MIRTVRPDGLFLVHQIYIHQICAPPRTRDDSANPDPQLIAADETLSRPRFSRSPLELNPDYRLQNTGISNRRRSRSVCVVGADWCGNRSEPVLIY